MKKELVLLDYKELIPYEEKSARKFMELSCRFVV
jgi:hypothetical protein